MAKTVHPQMWHVSIHETRAYSFYVRAPDEREAEVIAWNRWQDGSFGDEMEEESIDTSIGSTAPDPDRTEETV